MLSPTDKGNFLELNEHFLLAARTISLNRPLVIEDLGEAPLDNKAALSQVLSTVFPETSKGTANVICTLRPRHQFIHLARDEEARQYSTPAALRDFVSRSPYASLGTSEIISVQARTGMPFDGKSVGRWLLAGVPQDSLFSRQTALREWKLTPVRIEAATISLLGAILAEQQINKTSTPLLVWEIGEESSDLLLINSKGLEASRRLAFGFDKVAEAVQAEINLKFKGAAARLFFNEFYDFSEVGPKIAARAAAALQSTVAEFVSTNTPAALLCVGLTSKQSWFNQYLAKSLGLAPWQPNLVDWCSNAGVKFAGNTLPADLSPVWLGLLGTISSFHVDKPAADSAWHAAWSCEGQVAAGVESTASTGGQQTPKPAPATVPVAVTPPIEKAVIAVVAPAVAAPTPPVTVIKRTEIPVAATPPLSAKLETVTSTPPAARTIPSAAPAIAPVASAPTPAAAVPAQITSARVTKAPETPATVTPLSASQEKTASSAAPAAHPAPSDAQQKRPPSPAPSSRAAVASPPLSVPAKASLAAKPSPSAASPERKRSSFFKTPVGLATIGVVVIALGLGIFFYLQVREQRETARRAQVLAEQRAAAEAEARRKTELQAKALLRVRAEQEAAQKNAAAEAARKQAAEESRRLEIETKRLLNARGSLVITTEPVGANVSINNLAARVSPATINDLRLGHYTVNISLAGYDPMSLDLEVKENTATNPGVIRLVRQLGNLDLVTEPAGIKYEVRSVASRFFTTGANSRQGVTPATLNDLPTGEYVVTLSRDGWPNHEENVVIGHKDTAHVSWKPVGGSVELTSTPKGAKVMRNGVSLGVTPLTLNDLPPGDVSYTLELPECTPATVNGTIEPERNLRLDATLEASAERIARISELDERPVPIKRVEPSLNYDQERIGGNVTISLIVDLDGTPKSLKIEKQSDPTLGRRCLEAASQWRFKPGMIKGKPVKTRVTLPFIITGT
jgi:TonB family protein